MAQDIPVVANGTFEEPTWAESGTFGASSRVDTGNPQGIMVDVNDFNAPRKLANRWIRALRDRLVPSDAGLFGSFLIQEGAWTTGGGTLDSSLGVTWAIIDGDDDGGTFVQAIVPAASPHTFAASKDTYVNLNEDGTFEYQAVANMATAPTPSSGYVAVWKVVTDGTEVTSAPALLDTVPLFKDVQAEAMTAYTLVANGPSIWYTHASDESWMANFRPQSRTFAAAGTLTGTPDPIDIQITSTSTTATTFAGLPDDGVATIVFQLSSTQSIPTTAIGDVQDTYTNGGRYMVSRTAGTWAQIGGSDSEYFINDAVVVSFVNSSGNLLMRIQYDAAHALQKYRVVVSAEMHFIQLDP